MPTAALYIRVSGKRGEDGTSLESQLDAELAFADEHGFLTRPDLIFREVHTGRELWERPQLTALREQVRARQIQAIICYTVDRFARDPAHLMVLLSEAEHAGVEVLFVDEVLENSSEGQLIAFIKGYAARLEHAQIKERTWRGKLKQMEHGRPLAGARAPYGYCWVDDLKTTLALTADADIVARIFGGLRSGKTLRGMAAALDADGIPTPLGRTGWTVGTLRQIVSQPIYTGVWRALRWKTVRKAGKVIQRPRPLDEQLIVNVIVPPIVTEAEQAECLAAFARNRAQSTRNQKNPTQFLLRSGFVHCGDCGRAMAARTQGHPGAVRFRYHCSTNSVKPSKRCGRPVPSIEAAILDDAVWGKVRTLLTDSTVLAQQVRHLTVEPEGTTESERYSRELAKVVKQQAALAMAVSQLDDAAAMAPLLTQLKALGKEKERLEEQQLLGVLRRKSGDARQLQLAKLEGFLAAARGWVDVMTYDQKRLLLEALGVQVRVYPMGHEPRWDINWDLEGLFENSTYTGLIHKMRKEGHVD